MGFFKKRNTIKPTVGINIVPLVDVSLVLLIIFMITATFINTSAMSLNLPTASKHLSVDSRDITIEIQKNGTIFADGKQCNDQELGIYLQSINDKTKRVTIRGDKAVAYGSVVHVMSIASDAEFKQLVIVSKLEN